MQGIQSLMPGQAQQAPLPGMMPKPGASTPPAVVAELEMLPSQQLLQMYSQKPSLQILAALDKAYKREELGQSIRGQQAMQAAQPGTVADQVVSKARGVAQFAGGGAVAFTNGTGPDGLPQQDPQEDISDDPSLPLMERIRRSQRRMEMNRQQGVGRPFAERFPREAEAPVTDTGDDSERMLRRAPARQPLFSPEAIALMQRQGPRGIASVGRQEAPSRVMPRAQSQAPVNSPVENTTQVVSPEALLPFAEREAQLRSRMARPESLTKAEQAVADLMRANLQAQQEEAKTYGEEIRAARDAALARSQRNILSDPMSLLALAGSIDTRKGQGIGSLARGAAGLMGQREAAAEAARKEFTQAQRDERAMQANIRQTQMLEAQRQLALEQGKLNEVNAINDQLSALAMEREKFKITRGDVAFNQAMEGRKVVADEERARAAKISAAKPNEIDLALNRPEEYKKMLETRAAAQQLKKSPEQVRAETLERYADNWEKLDMLQKGELAKQGVTNFQQYVRMRDQMANAGGASAPSGKTMTMADVQATAKASGKTVDEVRKAATAAGYTIQ